MAFPAPQGLVAKIKLGRDPRGLASYLLSKGERAQVLASTFASGLDSRRWHVEVSACQQLAPRVQRSVIHCSLSAPVGVAVTDEQFRAAAREYLVAMRLDPDAHAWALVRHDDTPHQHCHILVTTVNPVTRRAWSDSQSYARNVHAARRAARAAGIEPPREGPSAPPSPSTKAVKAGWRERRRRARARPEAVATVMTPAQMAAALRAAVDAAQGHDEQWLVHEARQRGLEVDIARASTGRVVGLKARQNGGETWIKGSELGRDLSWPRIAKRLAAERTVEPARPQPEADCKDRPDSLLAGESRTLSSALPGSSDVPAPDHDHDHDRVRAEAQVRLDAELRAMSFDHLFELRTCSTRIPPVLLAAERLAALLNLVVRPRSLGVVKLGDQLALARDELAARASSEIERRRQSHGSIAQKLEALDAESKALERRRLALEARESAAQMSSPRLTPREEARARVERAHAPEISQRRRVLAEIRKRIEERKRRLAAEEKLLPNGIAKRLFVRRDLRARIEANRAEIARDEVSSARRASELEAAIEDFEQRSWSEIAFETQIVISENRDTQAEIEHLRIEITRDVVARRKDLERQAERERLQRLIDAERDDADDGESNRHQRPRPR